MATRGWNDVTPAQAAQMGRRTRQDAPGATIGKASKYRNVKTVLDGHGFDSKREAAIYAELKLREKAGEIRNLMLQVPWPLMCPNDDRTGYAVVAQYIADFVFDEKDALQPPERAIETWHRVVADCKGGRNTQMFALKKKWLELQSGIQIREIR